MRLYLILLFQCILIPCLVAQEDPEPGFKKNIIYIEGESILALGNTSISFERIFRPEKHLQLSLKGGVGLFYDVHMGEAFAYWTIEKSYGIIYKLSSFLILKGNFEIGLGISLMNCTTCSQYWDSVYKIYPIVSFGWRTGNHRPFFIKVHGGSWGIGLGLGSTF